MKSDINVELFKIIVDLDRDEYEKTKKFLEYFDNGKEMFNSFYNLKKNESIYDDYRNFGGIFPYDLAFVAFRVFVKILAGIKDNKKFIEYFKLLKFEFSKKIIIKRENYDFLSAKLILSVVTYYMVIKFFFFNLCISKTNFEMIDKNGKDVEVSLGWTLLDQDNLLIIIEDNEYVLEKVDGKFNIYNKKVKGGTIKLENGLIIIEVGGNIYKQKNLINENVSQSKKLLKEYELKEKEEENIVKVNTLVSKTRYILEKNNSLGYLGFFTNLIIKDNDIDIDRIKSAIDYIFELKPILSELRKDNKRIELLEIESFEDLLDCLIKLSKWRSVNSFFKKFPPKQKSLIWVDGYYTDTFLDMKSFIEDFILKITPEKEKRFFSKISSIKNSHFLFNYLKSFMSEDYTMEDVIKMAEKEKDAIITYANNGIVVIAVFTHEALCNVSIDCGSWCIIRDESYFHAYIDKGYKYKKDIVIQYVAYNFNVPLYNDNRVLGFTICANYDDYNINVFAIHNRSDDVPDFTEYDNGNKMTNFFWKMLIIGNMNHHIMYSKNDIDKAKIYKSKAEKGAPSMMDLVNMFLLNDEINKRTKYIDKNPVRRILRKKYISNIIDFLD